MIDSSFEDNSGVALAIDQSESLQGNCGSDLPLFNLSTVRGNGDQYLDQYIGASALGSLGLSMCVDVRSTTFSRNVDTISLPSNTTTTVPQYHDYNNYNNYRGGAGINIRATQSILLADLQFDGNRAWQAGALFLDTCSFTVLW